MEVKDVVNKIDGLVKSLKKCFFVIPVETGIQSFQIVVCSLDTSFRGYDDFYEFVKIGAFFSIGGVEYPFLETRCFS